MIYRRRDIYTTDITMILSASFCTAGGGLFANYTHRFFVFLILRFFPDPPRKLSNALLMAERARGDAKVTPRSELVLVGK
jgi:hypothetical protein